MLTYQTPSKKVDKKYISREHCICGQQEKGKSDNKQEKSTYQMCIMLDGDKCFKMMEKTVWHRVLESTRVRRKGIMFLKSHQSWHH